MNPEEIKQACQQNSAVDPTALYMREAERLQQALAARDEQIEQLRQERDAWKKHLEEANVAWLEKLRVATEDRDSWRRTSERLEGEKQALQQEVERLQHNLDASDEENKSLRAHHHDAELAFDEHTKTMTENDKLKAEVATLKAMLRRIKLALVDATRAALDGTALGEQPADGGEGKEQE